MKSVTSNEILREAIRIEELSLRELRHLRTVIDRLMARTLRDLRDVRKDLTPPMRMVPFRLKKRPASKRKKMTTS